MDYIIHPSRFRVDKQISRKSLSNPTGGCFPLERRHFKFKSVHIPMMPQRTVLDGDISNVGDFGGVFVVSSGYVCVSGVETNRCWPDLKFIHHASLGEVESGADARRSHRASPLLHTQGAELKDSAHMPSSIC